MLSCCLEVRCSAKIATRTDETVQHFSPLYSSHVTYYQWPSLLKCVLKLFKLLISPVCCCLVCQFQVLTVITCTKFQLVFGYYTCRSNTYMLYVTGSDLVQAWNPVCIGLVYGVIGKIKIHPGNNLYKKLSGTLWLTTHEQIVYILCRQKTSYKCNTVQSNNSRN